MKTNYLKIKIILILGIMLFIVVACKNTVNEKESSKTSEILEKQQEEFPVEQPIPQDEPVNSFQWPEDFIPGVPVLDGKISSINFDEFRAEDEVQEPQFVRIELIDIEEEAANQFIDGLKAGGYTQNPIYEKNSQHIKYYVMDLPTDQGNRVYFKWNPENKNALAVLLKPGQLALQAYLFHYDDTTDEDLSPWPQDILPNFPEPKGKIVDVAYHESDTPGIESIGYDVLIYYGDRQSVFDCIQEMKKRYYVEADEVITDNELMYAGLSDFYGGKFDSAYIRYYSLIGSPLISNGEESDEKYKIITVSMSKAK